MHISIEQSKSGKTFGIAIHKTAQDKPFMVVKGCRMASGSEGPFVSGPSTKMDDGKWFNYVFMDRAFSEHVTKLALAAQPQERQEAAGSDDIPF